MKAYTDLSQSKKLAEILPLESADMVYAYSYSVNEYTTYPYPLSSSKLFDVYKDDIPCWSASALLESIRKSGRYELQMYEGGYYFEANGFMTESYFNVVDVCVEMIVKLKEKNLI